MVQIEEIQKLKYVIISVIGPHAGEPLNQIFSRKMTDVKKAGKTFWVISSNKASLELIHQMKTNALKENKDIFCIFIEPSQKGGSQDTKQSEQAKEYSEDKKIWQSFDEKISPITGKITTNSYAMVFDELSLVETESKLNLWNYADFDNQNEPIKLNQYRSTFCGIQKDMSNNTNHMKKQFRKIVAVAKLHDVGAVWLR